MEQKTRPRLLLVHPGLGPPGGGEGLAAWLIQSILDSGRYHLTIACLQPPDFAGLNRYFDTSLDPEHPRLTVTAAPGRETQLVRTARRFGLSAALLEMSLLSRWVNRFVACGKTSPFDLYLSTCNEWTFPPGTPALQYIHYPKYHPVRGTGDYRWFHHLPGFLKAYRTLANRLASADFDRIRSYRTLANSAFTAAAYEEYHGVPAHVVHPPLPGDQPESVSWQNRTNRIVALGRLAQEKRVPDIIDIVRRIRETLAPGADLPSLHLIGSWDRACEADLHRRIRALVARHADWLHLHLDLPRAELDDFLAHSRYGLHAMTDEHFGMGIAEMQRAGCVVFVPDTGGPKEIVGEDEPRQLFSSPEDAVAKLTAVLIDESLQHTLHERALSRGSLFSTDRFIEECLAHIDAALSGQTVLPAGNT